MTKAFLPLQCHPNPRFFVGRFRETPGIRVATRENHIFHIDAESNSLLNRAHESSTRLPDVFGFHDFASVRY